MYSNFRYSCQTHLYLTTVNAQLLPHIVIAQINLLYPRCLKKLLHKKLRNEFGQLVWFIFYTIIGVHCTLVQLISFKSIHLLNSYTNYLELSKNIKRIIHKSIVFLGWGMIFLWRYQNLEHSFLNTCLHKQFRRSIPLLKYFFLIL